MPLFKYLVQYRFRDIGDFMRNDKRDPKPCSQRLDGKTIVITGATSGIGLACARLFARQGASLVCVNRDPAKSAALERELAEATGCRVRTILADFAKLAEVRRCAEELLAFPEPLDVIIHNSGVYCTERTLSADGHELVFQVNHLAPFLINQRLQERLRAENRARIILVNSEGHRFALSGVHTDDLLWEHHRYTGLKSYGASKTAQLLTLQRWCELFAGTAVSFNAMHPGNVATNIGDNNGESYRSFKRRFVTPSARSPEVSAQALHYLAAAPELAGVSGVFYNLTEPERPAPHARDQAAVQPVWDASLALCGLS